MIVLSATPAAGHGGGLNADGCHNDRKNGGYHCHGGRGESSAAARPNALLGRRGSGVSFSSCAAARAAGAAPLREGDPGYSFKLDRDRDGIACE